ncbi:MAG TPA: SsrA-binding protein SmpB [Cryomorphaceae bacterium]|nr:SsrA-binding protein SmpB [Cryomorphaceae bacterium]
MKAGQVNIRNKKASFEYELIDKYEAGIKLTGAEIKSIREGKASIKEAYCFFKSGELWIKNMHISPYEPASYNNESPTRDRKLLLNKGELVKLQKSLKDKGLTIVPTKVYIAESGYAKVEVALARGKKLHDKRESLKAKQDKRAMDRAMKH